MLHVVLLAHPFPVAGTDELQVAEHNRSPIDAGDAADANQNGMTSTRVHLDWECGYRSGAIATSHRFFVHFSLFRIDVDSVTQYV